MFEIIKSYEELPGLIPEGWEIGFLRGDIENNTINLYKYIFSTPESDLPYIPKELRQTLAGFKYGSQEGIDWFENLFEPGELKLIERIPSDDVKWDWSFNYGDYLVLCKIF